jgi:tetratricopeptide (TPR) repeat protein
LPAGAEKAHQLTVLADLYTEFEQTARAEGLLSESAAMARGIPDNWFKAERLVEIAQSYSELPDKERSLAILEEALLVTDRIDLANRSYFLFNIVDILLSLENKARALDLLNGLLAIINQDQSTFSRAGALIEIAERYRDAGREKRAVVLLSYARETADKAESENDMISAYARIADLLAQLGEYQAALDLAEKAFYLCGNLKNERTHIYLLGDLALVYLDLKATEQTARCVSRILELVEASDVRTLGLGEVAGQMAEAGEIVLALKLARVIREAEVKARALCDIASSLVAQNLEPTEEMELAVRELSDGTSSQRGLI